MCGRKPGHTVIRTFLDTNPTHEEATMRNHKMTTALLTALPAMAIVAPGATAQPIDSATPMAASALPAGLNGGYGPEGSAPTASHQTPATTAGPASDGFDW